VRINATDFVGDIGGDVLVGRLLEDGVDHFDDCIGRGLIDHPERYLIM
jgi:hypothetical protein